MNVIADFVERVRRQLGELREIYLRLSDQVRDLYRRHDNAICMGVVVAVQAAPPRVQVSYDGKKSPWIPWRQSSAGRVFSWLAPSIGEQVVLLNYGGGDKSSQMVAFAGFNYQDKPAPSDNLDEWRMVFPNGSEVSLDWALQRLTVFHVGDADVEVTADLQAVVGQDLDASVGGHASLFVGGDISVAAGGKLTATAGGDCLLSSASKIALAAPTLLMSTASGGEAAASMVGHFDYRGSFVFDGPATFKGPVRIENSLHVTEDISCDGSNPNNHGH